MIYLVHLLFYQIMVDRFFYALLLVTLLVGWIPLQLFPIQCDGVWVVKCLMERVIYIVEGHEMGG